MTTRVLLGITFALSSCVDDAQTRTPAGADASAASAQPDASDAARTRAGGLDTPDADEDPAAEPPPDALHVALEGRCEFMNVSVVSGEPFVAYGGALSDRGPAVRDDLIAARIAPDGSIAERLPSLSEKEVAPELGVYSISGFSGRWPNQLFAELGVGYRDSSSNDLARLTPNGWLAVDPFGKPKADSDSPALDRVHPWYDNSILAVGSGSGWGEKLFAVVRGKPKGPRMQAAKAKTGCQAPNVTAYTVVESGDVVAGWTCEPQNDKDKPRHFVTHWPKGDLDGTTAKIDGGHAVVVAHDGKGGFWLLASDDRAARLFHGKGDDWAGVDLPAKGAARKLAVDPHGRPWIVVGDRIHRRDGDAWTSEEVPGTGRIEELVGVEIGTPWIRRGGTSEFYDLRSGARVFRRGSDGWHEIAIPPSAFFAGKTIGIDRLHVRGPDDVWVEGHYFVRRRAKGAARHYRVILHSRPVARPLRCGEVIDGPIAAPFAPWPTAVNEQCKTRMALLFHQSKWDDAEDYPKLRKAVRGIDGVDGARLVEAEIGGDKFLAALVATDATVEALFTKARKLRPYKFPEVVCGDPQVLDRAEVKIHRELAPLAGG